MSPTSVDPWADWLALSEWDRLTVGTDRTARWPADALPYWQQYGLLTAAPPSQFLECPDCRDGQPRELVRLGHPRTGSPLAILPCATCGPVEIPLADLQRWQIVWSALVPLLVAGLRLRGQPQPIVPERLWQLGKGYWNGRPTTLFLGRAFHRHDAGDLIAPVARFTNALILLPRRPPSLPLPHPVLTLDLVATWTGAGLEFDEDFVTAQAAASPAPATKRPPKKEGQRAAVRLRLKRELDAHIAACRSHVQAALDLGRSPTLLPFPSYDELARRCGTSKATISRCLKDDVELGRMCAAARDLFRQLAPQDSVW